MGTARPARPAPLPRRSYLDRDELNLLAAVLEETMAALCAAGAPEPGSEPGTEVHRLLRLRLAAALICAASDGPFDRATLRRAAARACGADTARALAALDPGRGLHALH
jgi:hypothetical protein